MAGESKESICKRLKLTPEILDLFPDRLVDSELGEIPDGWGVGTFGDLCKSVQSGGTPKRIVAQYWNGQIDWLTSGEVRNPIVFDAKEKITEAALAESNAKLWPAGTTVVAMYGATAGEVCLLASEMCSNQACCGLIPLPDYEAFLFLSVRKERRHLADKSSGSAQQNLNKGLVESHSCSLPVESIITSFQDFVSHILKQWIINERECDALTVVRGALLPKLISGEIRIPEAEHFLEAVTR
jgi:type I restriction enzyme S subunit